MNYALRQGWITVNPLAGWAGTKYKAAVAQTDEAMADLRVREFAAFVKWLRDGNDDFYYVAVALSLGLRPGEVCGLELDSLRPLHAPKGEDKPLGLVIDREYSQSAHRIVPWVKTSGSVRTLKLTAGQAAIFGEWMLIRQNLSIPEDWARNQLFPHCWTRRGGAWHGRNRNALWMEWGKKLHDFIMDFAATSEMTVSEERYRSYYYFRPHFNRHLAATRMADARVPIRTAMATLGHLTESMTEHYTHIMDDSKSAAMDALDAALTQKSTLM
jgi:integrase